MEEYQTLANEKNDWMKYIEGQDKVVHEKEVDINSKKEAAAELNNRLELKQNEIKHLQNKLKILIEQVNDDRKDLEHENSIVEFLEGKLANAEKEVSFGKERVEELERRMASIQVAPGSLELQQLQQLERRIATKLEELECPVCFTTCSPPIYTCPNQHLVCSTCHPRLTTCPECRVTYGGQMRVHRYAERDAREVEEMRREVTTLRKSLYGRAQENAQVKAEEKMLIHVKEYNGHIKTFEVLPTNTVIEVMEFYDLSFRSPLMKLCNLSFFFKGKILQEDQTLEFYNIKNMDIINIIQ